jgi:alkylhydroperoxidase family enzyme
VVDAVCRNWRTAPVDAGVRATLGFLEKLTLEPDDLGRADADAVRAAGVATDALVDAIHIAALFTMIVRIADSLGFDLQSPEALLARAEGRLTSSYQLLETP